MRKQHSLFKRWTGKIVSTLAAAAMVAAMGSTAVFAAPPPTVSGSETSPAAVSIWKNIQMPTGTNTPAGTATFSFTPVSVDGTAAGGGNMPSIPARTVTFTAGDAGDAQTDNAGVKTVSKKTGNIIDGVTFPHAGEYIYDVVETSGGFTLTNDATTAEQMDYSTMTYRVQIIVANNASGTGLYVSSITAGVFDPVTSTTSTKVNDTSTEEGVGFGFTNKFNRTHIGSATDPDAALQISKRVSGASGNQAAYFPFTVTVTDPASLTSTTTHGTYKAMIVESGAAVDPTDNGITGAASDHSFNVTAGSAFTFKLKHGQSLAFVDLPVGASYTTTETDAQGHTANLTVTHNGSQDSEITALSTGAAKYIGEGANSAAFRNDKDLAAPTGILMNNLPYILLIGFAGVLIFAVVLKKRREA
jgi:hypothetical protein